MNLKYIIVLFLSISCFSACNTEEKPLPAEKSKPVQEDHSGHDHAGHNHVTFVDSKNYADNGVQFSIPDGWKYAESPIPGVGIYIMVEKQGDDESGQLIASVINKKLPLSGYMGEMQKQLKESFELNRAKYSFDEIQTQGTGDQETLNCKFKHTIHGLDFTGTMKAFFCNEKTIYLFTQEAVADTKKNKSGFDLLHKTFKCL